MSTYGGSYGDYEVANEATRVLENRISAESIYSRRVFNAKGGSLAYLYTGIGFGLGLVLLKGKLPNYNAHIGASAAVGFFTYLMCPYLIGNSRELSFLRNNKDKILEKTNRFLIEDYKSRMNIFPESKEE